MRAKVYVCAPVKKGDPMNRAKNLEYCRFVYRMGGIPIAPYIYFEMFINHAEEGQNRDGIEMGIQLLEECDELWVFGREVTCAMREELNLARRLKIKVHYVFDEHIFRDPLFSAV